MKQALVAVLLFLSAALLPHGAGAQLLGDARVAFSADREITVDDRTYPGKLYARPGLQRHEQELGGIQQVIILKRDGAHGWLVLPGMHSYVEFYFPRALDELSDPSLRSVAVGKETISGLRTTKYRIEHTARDGTSVDGYVWVSDQGIIVKADGTYTAAKGGRRTPVKLLLSNIRVAPQDQALFDVPQNFMKLPTSALQPLLGQRG
jgi:hypothetical protein